MAPSKPQPGSVFDLVTPAGTFRLADAAAADRPGAPAFCDAELEVISSSYPGSRMPDEMIAAIHRVKRHLGGRVVAFEDLAPEPG